MTINLEDQLRLDMEQATRDIRVPGGLAATAYRRGRKRRTTRRMATAAVTAAALASAAAIAGASGTFDSAPASKAARLTAYVISHVQRALAPAVVDNLVGSVRETYPPGTTVEPVPGGLNSQLGSPSAASRWAVGYSFVWAYQRTTRFVAYTPGGQPVFDAILTHPKSGPTETAVIYPNRTWWTAAVQTRNPAPVGCLRTGGIYLRPGPGGGWPGFIRSQLACGAYSVVGHEAVHGIDAIKLSGSATASIMLWVDPATYRPLQATMGPLRWTFRWLPATPANLARLQVSVPTGFQQVPPPPPNPSH